MAVTPPPRQTRLPEKAAVVKGVAENETDAEQINIPVGSLRIKDIAGHLISEIMVPVVGGGWIALPTREGIGGSSWVLQMGPGAPQNIEGGIINDLDQISLWRIPEDQSLESPELYSWSASKPLTWLALRSRDPPEPVEISAIGKQGNFDKGSLPGDLNDSGVFIQDGRVVGWTFGDFIDGAFLWTGDMGRNLKAEIRVDDFYRLGRGPDPGVNGRPSFGIESRFSMTAFCDTLSAKLMEREKAWRSILEESRRPLLRGLPTTTPR